MITLIIISSAWIQALAVLVGFAGCFFVLRADVLADAKKTTVRHGLEWRQRAALLSPFWLMLAAALNPDGAWSIVWCLLVTTGMLAFNYWNLFDGWLNSKRGHGWWFTGSDDPDDAFTDDLAQGVKRWQHQLLKIGGSALFIIIYLLILLK